MSYYLDNRWYTNNCSHTCFYKLFKGMNEQAAVRTQDSWIDILLDVTYWAIGVSTCGYQVISSETILYICLHPVLNLILFFIRRNSHICHNGRIRSCILLGEMYCKGASQSKTSSLTLQYFINGCCILLKSHSLINWYDA